MRTVLLMVGLVLAGCSGTMYKLKHSVGADQCPVPNEREAKITKRAWK